MPSPNPLVVLVATGETRGKISLPSAGYHLATWKPSISATTHRCPGLAGRHGVKYATRNNVRPQADRTVREQAQKRRKKIEANGSNTKNFFCPSGMPVLVLQLADPEKKYRATLFLPFPPLPLFHQTACIRHRTPRPNYSRFPGTVSSSIIRQPTSSPHPTISNPFYAE